MTSRLRAHQIRAVDAPLRKARQDPRGASARKRLHERQWKILTQTMMMMMTYLLMLIKIYLINHNPSVNPKTEKKKCGKLASSSAPSPTSHVPNSKWCTCQDLGRAYYDGAYSMPSTLGMGGKCRSVCKTVTSISKRNAHHQKQELKGLVFTGLYYTKPINKAVVIIAKGNDVMASKKNVINIVPGLHQETLDHRVLIASS